MKKDSWVFAAELDFSVSAFVRPALVPALIRLPIVLIFGGTPEGISFPPFKTGNVFRDILLALPRLCNSIVKYVGMNILVFWSMLPFISLFPPPASRFRRWYYWASGSNGVYDRSYWEIVDGAQQDHERALEALHDATTGGRGFILLLRDFPEEDLYDDKGLAPAGALGMLLWLKTTSQRGGRWRFLYDLAHAAGIDRPIVTIGNPRSSLPAGRSATGVHHLFVANWMPAMQLLLQKADSIIIYGGKSGRSMEFELSEILRIGKEQNSIIISRPKNPLYDRIPEADYTRLAKMLGYDGDPSLDFGRSDESLKAFDNQQGYVDSQVEFKRLAKEWIQTVRAHSEHK